MERLTPEDASFLRIEDRVTAMHGLTVAVFDGPEPRFDELLARMARRVSLVPRLRQRVVDVPGGVERPLWVDDPHFSLDYHMRHTGLPKNGTMADVQAVTSRILSQRLDRGKPLWEMWMIDGLPDGRWAVLSKAHHSMVDGVSGTDPLTLVIDGLGEGPLVDEQWDPPALPTEAQLLGQGVLELVFDPAHQVRLARRRLISPARRALAMLGRPDASNGAELVGAVGSFRRWGTTSVSAERIQHARNALEVSTNDVVLGLVSDGFRSMLEASGVAVPKTIRTLVPLAVATGNRFNNEISSLEADLPVGEPDLSAAIRAINAQTADVGREHRAVAGNTLASLHGLSAPTVATLGLRSAHRTARYSDISTVTVNVPGPSEEVRLLDRPMVAIYPAIPLVSRVRISVGIMSYLDQFHFGVTGDNDAGLEVDALTAGIVAAASSLP
jgi:WS/DGAT/MGAT family acyltransferase